MKYAAFRRLAGILAAVMLLGLAGCGMHDAKQEKEPISVYLWSVDLLNKYAPYIQSQLPDLELEFVVGNNDLSYYQFLADHGALPDIITNRRFALHDAKGLEEYLMDLSQTEIAGAYYATYLENYRNTDGTINWLPACGEVDTLMVNKALFDQYHIPLPTDYNSFVSACRAFEEHGIRGFVSDFAYDYTCLEILQGLSIPKLTSLEGQMWRMAYEDPTNDQNGLDDVVWPAVFDKMERFIQDVGLTEEDIELDYDLVAEMFRSGKVAMIRETGAAVSNYAEVDGVETMLLPYFDDAGDNWLLSYPAFQVALNRKLESDGRKDDAMRVLEVMLSQDAQSILAAQQDVISYKKDVKLTLRDELKNLEPYIESNQLYIRMASNDFFAVSKDVVQKMIRGEYNAEQAYTIFDQQLENPNIKAEEPVVAFEKAYSRTFGTDGGSPASSAIANTLRKIYGADLLISPAYNFTSPILNTGYSEKMLGDIIMPNACRAFLCEELTGADVKTLVKASVEGVENAFIPFNRGSLPVLSGMSIEVQETEKGIYTLNRVLLGGEEIEDGAIYKVAYLNPVNFADRILPKIFPQEVTNTFSMQDTQVKQAWTQYIENGAELSEPEKYIVLK